MPPTVQVVIAARLAQLSPPARELVGLAAVIGRTFTFEVLAQASGNDEDTLVQGLDELWQRRIVREQGGDAYDFSHDKLREGAYTALSAARRRLLHRRVAETLEMGYGGSHEQVGDIFALTGRFDRARESYQSALSQVPEHQFVWQARLYRKIGKTALSPMNSEAAFERFMTWSRRFSA